MTWVKSNVMTLQEGWVLPVTLITDLISEEVVEWVERDCRLIPLFLRDRATDSY